MVVPGAVRVVCKLSARAACTSTMLDTGPTWSGEETLPPRRAGWSDCQSLKKLSFNPTVVGRSADRWLNGSSAATEEPNGISAVVRHNKWRRVAARCPHIVKIRS